MGTDGGAQIVVCRLDEEPEEYVMKVYDPLYYGFYPGVWADNPRDVVYTADLDYCGEVAAFLELDHQLGGKKIPKYYGSWTFQMPLELPDGKHVRNVRVILMEKIEGRAMSNIDPAEYSAETRLVILKQILEAGSHIHFAGVLHGDFEQRNIMICEDVAAKTIAKVVVLDFNFAMVYRLSKWHVDVYWTKEELEDNPWLREPVETKPPNPMCQWWDVDYLYGFFGEWLPESWELSRRRAQEWLHEQWGQSDEFRPSKKSLVWKKE